MPLSLAFELERGGEPEAQDEQPTVWRVDEPMRSADLQRRFSADWSRWYGPVLVPHAAAIAALLADEAALALRLGGLPGTEHPRVWGGPLLQPDREQRFCSLPLPLWWALPVVRKRSRRLRLQLRTIDSSALVQALQPVLTPEWRGQPPLSMRLEFETRMYWGAQAEPDNTPGGVRWLPCRVRSDGLVCSAPIPWPGWAAEPAAHEAENAQRAIERRLRGGIGLLLVLPSLVLERTPTPTASRLRQRLQLLQQLPQRLARVPRQPHEPGLASRWASDEAWWARSIPTARMSDGALARAIKRGAKLQPASLPALRRAGPDRPREHVLLLHGQQQSVRSAFAAALIGEAAALGSNAAAPAVPVGALWPGLPLLDTVATWRFEHDPWQGLAASVAVLAAAITGRIVAPRGGGSTTHGGRLVLLAQGQGGLLARLLLQAWREPWAEQGWRLDAITLGTPHLGQPLHPAEHGPPGCCRLPPLAGALDASACASAEVDRAAQAERLRLSRWLAGAPPQGLADAEPQALRRLLGGDLARLPRGMWLLGSIWGAPPAAGLTPPGELRPAWLADEPAQSPASGDGAVSLDSALAGRIPWHGQPGAQGPPEDGVLAFDVSPARHGDYLAQPAVRQLVSRALAHLLGRDGSWA